MGACLMTHVAQSGLSEQPLPKRIIVDANGFYWREYEEWLSMCPQNPDNNPAPKPFTYYVPEARVARLKTAVESFLSLAAAYNLKGDFIDAAREAVRDA